MRSFPLGKKTEVKFWTNPYVTDGLVAMWDAEWNAGGGIHDNNAKSLVDLSGGGWDISAPDATFGDNWMTSSAPIQFESPDSWKSSVKEKNFSVEIACEYLGEFTSDKQISPTVIWFAMLMSSTEDAQSASVRFTAAYEYSRSGGVIAIGTRLGENDTNSFDYYKPPKFSLHGGKSMGDSGPYQFSRYCTAINTVDKQVDNRTKYPYGEYVYLCSDPRARIYSIRFYDRALTEDEAWANINVDKARFGI